MKPHSVKKPQQVESLSVITDTYEDMLKRIFALAEIIANARKSRKSVKARSAAKREKTQD